MTAKRLNVAAAVLGAAVLLSACGSSTVVAENEGGAAGDSTVAASTPTPEPTADATAAPTSKPTRTFTPSPSPTRAAAKPTAEPEPTRTPRPSEKPEPTTAPESTKTPEWKPALVMLGADQVPTSTAFPSWTETKIRDGLRTTDPYCWQEPFPRASTKYRAIYDPKIGSGGISQMVVRMDSEAAAIELVEELAKCWPQEKSFVNDDGRQVTATTYGTYDVKDGLTVGATTWCGGEEFPDNSMMWAIGRDGREVTYVHFWPMREDCWVPKDMWIGLSKTALRQL
ncbi:MAG: hypothetical protein ACT4QF_12770 [Sporichthyaceae bacterium]